MNGKDKIAESLDLRGIQCPMTFNTTALALEGLGSGERLEVILDDGAGIVNVPRDLKDQGHKVLAVEPLGDGTVFRLLIEKA